MPSVPVTDSLPLKVDPKHALSPTSDGDALFLTPSQKTSNIMNRKFYEKLCSIAINYIPLVLLSNTDQLFRKSKQYRY